MRLPAGLALALVVLAGAAAHAQSTVFIGDASVVEGGPGSVVQLRFEVTVITAAEPASPAPRPPVDVTFATRDGIATVADGDYVMSSGVLNFSGSPGSEIQTIFVDVPGDLKVEADESLFVDLTMATEAMIGDGEGEGAILNDDATALAIGDTALTEGDSGAVQAVLTATLTAPSDFAVTAFFATRDGTATTLDGDYQSAGGMLTFTPGVTSQPVAVTVNGDLVVEADETFFVDVSNADGATLADAQGQATIVNDDQATVSIDDVSVSEGDAGTATATFTASLSAPSGLAISADFATRDGSATTADGDYAGAAGKLTFDPGVTTLPVAVIVNGDLVAEADETFFVDLSNPVGATLGDAEGLGTILNDDGVTISIDDVSVGEGDTGATSATFTASLSAPSAFTVTADFATRDGTARAADGDYRAASGTLTFAPGQTALPLPVTVVGDTRVEPDESFFVDLANVSGAAVGDGVGEATVRDDDMATIAIDRVTIGEGDAGSVSAVFTLTLSAASATAVGVDFATRDGSARVSDGDYRAQSGRLTFAPGQTALALPIQVNGDTAVEPDEVFFVDLANPAGADIAVGVGRATIENDDTLSEIRLVAPAEVGESDGVAVVAAERIGDGSGAARVTLSAAAGTATADEDFTPVTRTLSWAAGQIGRRTARIPILDDNLSEADETVRVSLSGVAGAVLAAPAALDLLILDDDAAADLVIPGDGELTGKVGEEIALVVIANRADGQPVAGATVLWAAEGEAELLDGATTTTDAAGEARQRVLLGDVPGVVGVSATLGAGAGASAAAAPTVEFEITVQGDLDELFDPSSDSGEASVAGVLNDACLENPEDFEGFCDYLFGLDPADQRAAIRALTADEVAGQGSISINGQRVQLSNIGWRLAAARGGAGGAASRLSMAIRGVAVPLDRLGSGAAGAAGSEASFLARVDAALYGALQEPAAAEPELVVDEISRWSLFVNGRLEMGDRPGTRLEEGFDLETLGLTLGVDYRLRDDWVVGIAAGYLDTESDLAGGGALDASGFSLSAFGTYFEGDFWVDGIVTFGFNDYESARVIVLPEPFAGETRFVARAEPEGNQLTLALGAGYEAAFGAFTLGGFGNLSRVEVDIDPYTESGAAPFDLTVAEQSLESLLLEAGVELTWARSRTWGVLQPVLRASLLHEFEDDSRLIVGSFAADSRARQFGLPTDPPDRDYYRLGAGVTATLARGRSLYLLYETDLARDDLDLYRLSGGLRLEL